MARTDRSSDGPAPYGPSGQPPDPGQSARGPSPWGEPPAEDPGPPPPPSGGGSEPPAPPSGVPAPIAPWAPPPDAIGSGVPGAPTLVYGRTLDRVLAWWLDSIIVAAPAIILAGLLGGGVASVGLELGGATLIASIIAVGIHLLYFVAFWTGSSQATLGMRLFKLRMGDATTGGVLTVQQGLLRWLAIGGAFQLVEIVPDLAWPAASLAFLWVLLLLVTTATSPTKQGLHDRIANSALVQPAGAQTPTVTCLVLLVGLLLVWVVAVVALVFLGGQISQILSDVGTSI